MATLRPDEYAAMKETERNRRFEKGLGSAISTAAGFGLGGLAQKAAPFLSEFISPDVALKGLNKVAPRLGSFLKKGLEQGLDLDEGLSFLRERVDNTIKETKKPKSLFDEFLGATEPSTLSEGQQAQLAFLRNVTEQLEAKGVGKDNPALKRIRKKVKDVIEGKVSEVLGQAMAMQPQEGQQMPEAQPPQQMPMGQPQAPMQQPGQPAQPGQGQQALMAILQKIQAQRGM